MIEEFVLKYWLEAVFGLLIAGLSWGYKRIIHSLKVKQEEQDAIMEGMKALLHDRLLQSGMYYINRGYIYAAELERFEKLYVAYHEGLKLNGTGTEIYERVNELEIKNGV